MGPVIFGVLSDVSGGFALPLSVLTLVCVLLLLAIVWLRLLLRGRRAGCDAAQVAAPDEWRARMMLLPWRAGSRTNPA